MPVTGPDRKQNYVATLAMGTACFTSRFAVPSVTPLPPSPAGKIEHKTMSGRRILLETDHAKRPGLVDTHV